MPLIDSARRVLALGLVLLCAFAPVRAQNVSDGFNPNPDSYVYAVALQADGKILLAGLFKHIGGTSRTLLARLNADGSVDSGFNPVITGTNITQIAVQADGKIVIAGAFSQVGATAEPGIARLNANGSVDSIFHAPEQGNIFALVVQNDGKILVGSSSIVRLNTDGSIDMSFTPPDLGSSGTAVGPILQQPDGRLLVGGYLHPNNAALSVPLIRLLSNGALDASFNPVITNGSSGAGVLAMALQPDGGVVFGGNFTAVGGYTVKNLGRVDASGNADATFDGVNHPALDGETNAIVLQPSGDILLGGNFTHVNSTARNHVARLTSDGTLGSYNPGTTDAVFAMVLQSDSELLLGGAFSQVGTTICPYIARIDINGNLDATLALTVDSDVAAIAAQPNGGVLIGGTFSLIGSTTRHHLARILANGSVDKSYNPSPDGDVNAIAHLSDGSALVAGFFKHIGGKSQAYLAHLDANGALDTSFAPLFDGAVDGIVQQPDGKIIVFSTYFSHIDGAARAGIGRLNANGSLDAPFNVPLDANSFIYSVALLPNGQVLIGGTFSQVAGGHDIRDIARLNADGSFDGTFAPVIGITSFEPVVSAIVPEPDGKVLIGGQFPSVDGQASASLARLNADGSLDRSMTVLSVPSSGFPSVDSLQETADGKILAAGRFTVGAGYPDLARLNHDGTLDTAFADLGTDNQVLALAIARDGKIVMGGYFQHVASIARSFLARLSVPQAAQQSLTVSSNTVTWLNAGSGAEVTQSPTLLYSSDDRVFAPLGTMSRVGGSWQYGGFVPPVDQFYWLRVQAPTASGLYNGSQGAVQYTRKFYLSDDIFKDKFGG